MTTTAIEFSGTDVGQIANVYDGQPITIRFLEALGWGGELLNLGYFRHHGIWNPLNLIPDQTRLASAQRRLVVKAVGLMPLKGTDRVLDVACGRGYATSFVARAAKSVSAVGMDLLPENIKQAGRRFGAEKGVSFQVGNACKMPFASASFDHVLCLEAAFHFPDRAEFLAEVHRVLKPQGTLVLVDFMWRGDGSREFAEHPLAKIVRKTWAWENFSAVNEYEAMLAKQKLEVVQRADWTKQVTESLQWQFNVVAKMSQSRFGRRLMAKTNPALAKFNAAEWMEIQTAARAHAFVNARSRYMAVVARKV